MEGGRNRRSGSRGGCGDSEAGPQPFSADEAWGYAAGGRDSASLPRGEECRVGGRSVESRASRERRGC